MALVTEPLFGDKGLTALILLVQVIENIDNTTKIKSYLPPPSHRKLKYFWCNNCCKGMKLYWRQRHKSLRVVLHGGVYRKHDFSVIASWVWKLIASRVFASDRWQCRVSVSCKNEISGKLRKTLVECYVFRNTLCTYIHCMARTPPVRLVVDFL